MARLVGGDPALALEHGDPDAVVAQRQLARDREADDPRADDGDVAFARRPRIGHAARLRRVALPLKPPIEPQLALSRKKLPDDEGWAYEPKYDGFRALAFVDGDELFLQSRSGRPLARYFPELVFPAGRYVLDGELLILGDDGAEVFDALQNRLHPAESRVSMLAEKTPRSSAPSTCSRSATTARSTTRSPSGARRWRS